MNSTPRKILLRNGAEWEIPDDLYRRLHELYYDVDAELAKMSLWCLGNPERRKTPRGASRFVTHWFLKGGRARPVGMPRSVVAVESGPRSQMPQEVKDMIAHMRLRRGV